MTININLTVKWPINNLKNGLFHKPMQYKMVKFIQILYFFQISNNYNNQKNPGLYVKNYYYLEIKMWTNIDK